MELLVSQKDAAMKQNINEYEVMTIEKDQEMNKMENEYQAKLQKLMLQIQESEKNVYNQNSSLTKEKDDL